MLRTLFLASLALVLALGGGALSAWRFARGGDALPAKPGWHAMPDRAALKADPYRRDPAGRRFAPDPNPGEKLFLAATRSSDGLPLRRDCVYTLEGRLPAARIWTLAALDPSFVPPLRGTTGLHSEDAVWQADGSLLVTLSAEAASGNWLPLDGAAETFILLIGLYDPQATPGAALATASLPPVNRVDCRSGEA